MDNKNRAGLRNQALPAFPPRALPSCAGGYPDIVVCELAWFKKNARAGEPGIAIPVDRIV